MNCFEFRQRATEDPYHLSPTAVAHKDECPHCTKFLADINSLDDGLREAFSVAVPEGLAARVLLNQSLQTNQRSPRRWYWLGMAASVLVALMLVIQLPSQNLQAEIITHLEHEAHQVHGKAGAIEDAKVNQVLSAVGGSLIHSLGNVTYASTCVIDDKLVAHLVVEYNGETFTLLLMPVAPDASGAIASERWIGVIEDEAVGTFAVISETRTTSPVAVKSAYSHFHQSIGQLALAQ